MAALAASPLAEGMRPNANSSSSSSVASLWAPPPLLAQPPSLQNCTMRSYQLEGLSWLVSQYDRRINSILADEMGLGKTLQSISFLSHLLQTRNEPGPHLVIVPLSVLSVWVSEFKKWCPSIRVTRFHSNDRTEVARIKDIIKNTSQVVVTTYDIIKSKNSRTMFARTIWASVILDEGHRIKNEMADVSVACARLRSKFRLILTGTPVQNNLHETYALLKYLAPGVFTTPEPFDDAFKLGGWGAGKGTFAKRPKASSSSVSAVSSRKGERGEEEEKQGTMPPSKKARQEDEEGEREEEEEEEEEGATPPTTAAPALPAKDAPSVHVNRAVLAQAHYLMRAFVLRRIKSEVEVALPPKLETKISCPMSRMQRFWVQVR